MSNIQFILVRNDEGTQYLTVFPPTGTPVCVADDHPNFDALCDGVQDGSLNADEIQDLADISIAVARQFTNLSEQVSVSDGRVYFDGDEVHGAISDHIVRALDEGADFSALVRFLENVAANPEEHSREQLYDWLQAHEFTIDYDGMIVGYKGVSSDGNGGYQSGWTGTAIVDGTEVVGHTPYAVGSVVEMPRSAVAHDPGAACSTGLHVGTFDYAQSYSRSGAMLRVLVNPRDVVSVPTEARGQKVRVCRLVVDSIIEAPDRVAVLVSFDDDPFDEDERCDCGGLLDEDGICEYA